MTNLLLLDPSIVESNEIRPVVIWHEENGIRYQDLNETYYEKSLEFIKNEYIKRNLLCKMLRLSDDKEATKEFLERMLCLLKGNCSIIGIDILTNEIIGIVVMFPMDREDGSWQFYRMKNVTHKAVEILIHFSYHFITNCKTLDENYNTNCVLHYFIVSIAFKMKGKLLKETLLMQAYKMARSMGIQTITLISETRNNQERCRRIGMRCIDQIHYGEYLDKDKLPIFVPTESSEPTCMLFAQSVGPKQNMCP